MVVHSKLTKAVLWASRKLMDDVLGLLLDQGSTLARRCLVSNLKSVPPMVASTAYLSLAQMFAPYLGFEFWEMA